MRIVKKLLPVLLAVCICVSLAAPAYAANLGQSMYEYDGVASGVEAVLYYDGEEELLSALYDENDRFIGIVSQIESKVRFDLANRDYSIARTFALDINGNTLASDAPAAAAAIVSSAPALNMALADPRIDNISIVSDITAAPAGDTLAVTPGKSVTLAGNSSLTMPAGTTLQLQPQSSFYVLENAELAVEDDAELHVNGAQMADSHENALTGAYLRVNGELELSGRASVQAADVLGGGLGENCGGTISVSEGGKLTVNAGAELRLDGETERTLEGGGTINCRAGNIEVFGADSTLTVSNGGSVEINNNAHLQVSTGGALNGSGNIRNEGSLCLQGGASAGGTLSIENNRELRLMSDYDKNDNLRTPQIGENVSVNENDGGWTYEAIEAENETELRSALSQNGLRDVEYTGAPLTLTGDLTVPEGINLNAGTKISVASGKKLNINGQLRIYGGLAVESGGELNVNGKAFVYSGNTFNPGLEVKSGGNAEISGTLSVGGDGYGYFKNSGETNVPYGGAVVADRFGTVKNDNGTFKVASTATLASVSAADDSGVFEGVSTAASEFTEVTNFEELKANIGASDVLLRNDIEIEEDIIINNKMLALGGVRVGNGVTLTLNGKAQFGSWLDNKGEINIDSLGIVTVSGDVFNDNSAKISLESGSLLYCASGTLFKNYGTVLVNDGGNVSGVSSAVIAWGVDSTMPVAGEGAYADFKGLIVSTRRTAQDLTGYAALAADASCDEILLGFDMTVAGDTVLRKNLIVQDGRTLTVNDGVTLKVRDNACLRVEGGGSLNNLGAVVIENIDGQRGRLELNEDSALYTASGTVDVYGDIEIRDGNRLTLTGWDNVKVYHTASTAHFGWELYKLDAANALTQAYVDNIGKGYADWEQMNGDEDMKYGMAYLLKTGLIAEPTANNNGEKYLNPYDDITYGEARAILGKLWTEQGKEGALPDAVAISGKTDADPIYTFDYGSGSELDALIASFMEQGFMKTVDGADYQFNSTLGGQTVSYSVFTGAVTVSNDGGPEDAIRFEHCVFNAGIVAKNSGTKYRISLTDCKFADGQKIEVQVVTDVNENPVFDMTDQERRVEITLNNTAGVEIDGFASCIEASADKASGSFKLNNATYAPAAGIPEIGSFTGKYQLDGNDDGGMGVSFHAGDWTGSFTRGFAYLDGFHMWDNTRCGVTVDLGSAQITAGDELYIGDDNRGDEFYITLTGSLGSSAGAEDEAARLRLSGKVDISGLTTTGKVDILPNDDVSLKLTAEDLWVSPAICGDYLSASVRIGSGDMTGYDISLTKRMWNDDGSEYWGVPDGVKCEYISGDGSTYVTGLPDTDDLMLKIKAGGKTVIWDNSIMREHIPATVADLALAMYTELGDGTTGAEEYWNQSFGTLASYSDGDMVNMELIAKVFGAATAQGGLQNYYTGDNEIGRVNYYGGTGMDAELESAIKRLASALAFGNMVDLNRNWDDEAQKGVLAVDFNADGIVGKSTIDKNGNTQLSGLVHALSEAMNGRVGVNQYMNIRYAAFAGVNTFSMTDSYFNVRFEECTFTGGGSDKLVFNVHSGGEVRFEGCDFSGSSKAIELVSAGQTVIEDCVNVRGLPSGATITSPSAVVEAECYEYSGSFTLNGVLVDGYEFSEYTRDYIKARLDYVNQWDDDKQEEVRTDYRSLGLGGAVEAVALDGAADGSIMSVNGWDDTSPIVVNTDGYAPPDGMIFRMNSKDEYYMALIGELAGGESEAGYVGVTLAGTVDASLLTLKGHIGLHTGVWHDGATDLLLGQNSIRVGYDANNFRADSIKIFTQGGTVTTDSLGLTNDDRFGVNDCYMVSLQNDGSLSLGNLTDEHVYEIYELRGNDWVKLAAGTDYTAASGTVTFTTPLSTPYNVRLHVSYTDAVDPESFSYAMTYEWLDIKQGGGASMIDVETKEELLAALGNREYETVQITGDITLDGGCSVPEYQTLLIAQDALLTVSKETTLIVNGGLKVNGTFTLNGLMHVYGWVDGEYNGDGMAYYYARLRDFATALYNRYADGYGLTKEIDDDKYESRYADWYYNDTNRDADGITALNFLMENLYAVDQTMNSVNGYDLLTYADAYGIMVKLAEKLETSRTMTGPYTIDDNAYKMYTGSDEYKTEFSNDAALCSDPGEALEQMLMRFDEAVALVSVTEQGAVGSHPLDDSAAALTPGLDGCYAAPFHTFTQDVTLNGSNDSFSQFMFFGCHFEGDVTVYGASADDVYTNVLFFGCKFDKNLTVMDSSGCTNVYFIDYGLYDGETVLNNAFTNESVVTVTQSSAAAAQENTYTGLWCKSIRLINLPGGTTVENSKVSAAIIDEIGDKTYTLNGVTVTTGFEYQNGYAALLFTMLDGGKTALGISGCVTAVDASNAAQFARFGSSKTGSFEKYVLCEVTEAGLWANDSVINVGAQSCTLQNGETAKWSVKYESEGDVIAPVIAEKQGGYEISGLTAIDGVSYSYKSSEQAEAVALTVNDGAADIGSEKLTDAALIITNDHSTYQQTVTVTPLTEAGTQEP